MPANSSTNSTDKQTAKQDEGLTTTAKDKVFVSHCRRRRKESLLLVFRPNLGLFGTC
jgi:hypothetical protein